jgi:hypothetical protein
VACWCALLAGDAGAHGGQRIVPVTLALESASRQWELRFSLDVALLFGGAVAVDRAWLGAQSEGDLDALAGDARKFLEDGYRLAIGGEEVPLDLQFPGLAELRDPAYDNGEPSGHIAVVASGAWPAPGGDVVVSLADEAIPAVVTTVVDGRALRRLAVLLGGESKAVTTLASLPAPPPGDVAGGPGDAVTAPAAGGDPGVPEEGGPGRLPGDELFPGEGDDVVLAGAGWGDVASGWTHVFGRGYGHWLLALAVFLGARRVALMWARWAAAAAGAAVVVVSGLAWAGRGPEVVAALAAAVLLADVAAGVRVPRPVGPLLFGVAGGAHAAGTSALFGGGGAREFTAAVEAGVHLGHAAVVFGCFVVAGWAWDRPGYRQKFARPLGAAGALAALACAAVAARG